MIVAIQGEADSFSDCAARSWLGDAARILGCTSFDDLFAAVSRGNADLGVVPIANAIAGPVGDNQQRVDRGGFRVVHAFWFPVHQCLIARPGARLGDVRRVASQPVALRQCARLLRSHPEWIQVEAPDTAGSVRALMTGAIAADAVIASSRAALRHGAQVLLSDVQDDAENATHFLIIARP